MKMIKNKILPFGLLIGILFVTACDDDESVTIQDTPQIDFSFSPENPVDEEDIVFSAEVLEGEVETWMWNFGDAQNSTSEEMNPTFSYPVGGDYEVSLTATDAAGNSTKVYKTVPVTLEELPAQIAWEFSTNTQIRSYNDGSSSPVIGDDGTIYYVESRAGAESSLVAVTDNGSAAQLKWASNAMGAELPNAPSIGPDGNIYINVWHDDWAITKINAADGTVLWSGPIGTDVSNNTSAVDSQGNTYHGSRSQPPRGGMYSWSPDGTKRWEITGVGASYAAPVISADESTVYFLNTSTGEIWAVNTSDGSLKWDAPVGPGSGTHGSSLSMDSDGTIYYTTNDYVAAIIDNGGTGSVKWSTEVAGAAQSGVVIGPEGDLYTGSTGGLISLDPEDGSVNWINDNVSISESVPAVDVDGNIYVGTTDGRLVVVHPYGEIIKEFQLGDHVVNSPTITTDGSVFVEARDGSVLKLYKITVEESGPAPSVWPMKGQNVKNTGRIMN